MSMPKYVIRDEQVFDGLGCRWENIVKILPREFHRVELNVKDCEIIISEFELQSRYYVHFRTNTFEKVMKSVTYPTALKVK